MHASDIKLVRYVTDEIDKKGHLRKVSYTVCIKLIKSFTIYEFKVLKK